MTGKLDWSKIQAMYQLGGYSNTAVLSNSTALLSMVALTLLQDQYYWIDWADEADIRQAIADGIDEIQNGGSIVSDYEKIVTVEATADCASLTTGEFDYADYSVLDVFIKGLMTDYGGNFLDGVLMQLSGIATASKYDGLATLEYESDTLHYENLGVVAGSYFNWITATPTTESNFFGVLNARIMQAPSHGFTTILWNGGCPSGTTLEGVHMSGIASAQVVPVNELEIFPALGSNFLINAAEPTEPGALTMSVYGIKG